MLNKFFQRINATLVKIYGVKENNKIYISGDLAKKYLGCKIDIDDLSCFDSYIEAYINALEQNDNIIWINLILHYIHYLKRILMQ